MKHLLLLPVLCLSFLYANAQCPVDLGPDTTACAGQSVLLDAGPGYTYLWSDSSTAQSLSVDTSGSYWVFVADTSGCTNSDTVSVVFTPGPSVSITGDTAVYWGYDPLECATLTANISGGTPPYSVLWSNGAIANSITVCDTISTSYVASVTDQNGCTATDTFDLQVIDVRCGNGLDKVLICHVPPGNPANEHNICISENAVPAHLAHGCYLGTCASVLAVPTQAGLELSVHPNPAHDRLFIRTGSNERTEVFIYDLAGKMLQHFVEQGPTIQITIVTDTELKGNRAVLVRCIDSLGRTGSATVVLE